MFDYRAKTILFVNLIWFQVINTLWYLIMGNKWFEFLQKIELMENWLYFRCKYKKKGGDCARASQLHFQP